MKRIFTLNIIALVIIHSSCSVQPEKSSVAKQHESESAIIAEEEFTETVKRGVWVYLSPKTFPGENIVVNNDLVQPLYPGLEKKLSAKETELLDSVMKGKLNAISNNNPNKVAACFWPKHAVVFYDENGNPYNWINICFECHNTRSFPEGLSNANVESWSYFFKRLNWPVGGENYNSFFDKAKSDSLFRQGKGNFQF